MANASDEDRTGDLLVQEVDEDLRREQYLQLWKRYGGFVVAGVAILVVGVAGWQGWEGWQSRQRLDAAGRYAAAQALVDADKTKDAEAALGAIATGDARGFAVLAGMRRAELLAKGGDGKGAMDAYRQIAESGAPPILRGLATIKEGMLALNAPGDTTAVEARLGALATVGNPWYYQASELIALFAHKKGDDKRAVDLFKKLVDDPLAPQGIRARAAEIHAALAPAVAPAPASAATPTPKPAPATTQPAAAPEDKK